MRGGVREELEHGADAAGCITVHGYNAAGAASYVESGSNAAAAAPASPGLSRERLFRFWRDVSGADDGRVRRTRRSRRSGRRVWEARRRLRTSQNPDAGRRAATTALLHARDAAVPVRHLHMGHVLNYTLGDVSTHFRRRSGSTVAAADGLRLVRPAGRERGDQGGRPSARDHRAQHRDDPRADAPDGLGDRLGPRGLRARAVVLPLDAVAVPEVLRARARLPQGGAGQLVPERPDRARERARRRRPLLALRRDRRGAEHGAVVLQDHRVRRRAARRPARRSTGRSGRRRSSATGSAAPRAPRSSSASTSSTCDIPVFTTRPDTLFGATFFVVAPESPLVDGSSRAPSAEEVQAYARLAGARRTEERAPREKTGVFTGRTRRTRSTASGSRSGSPTTC